MSGVILLGVVIAIVYSLVKYSREPVMVKTTPIPPALFRKEYCVMNRSEAAFFHELKKQLPSEYHIFPKMRIADVISAIDGEGFYRRRNYILPKHIDFLVCDPYFRPLVAVEINGSSHLRPDRMERDANVKRIFADAKLPLEFIDVGTNFTQSVQRVKSHFAIA